MDIRPSSLPSQLELRPVSESIVVAVNGGSSGWQALDWAAAEAAARRSPLRIVHVIVPPIVMFDPLSGVGLAWPDPDAPQVGALILEEAARRARIVAPDATVTTHLESGNLASTIRDAGRYEALTVLGRGRARRFGLASTSWRIARRAVGPVAIVELNDQYRSGPSAGRVVLGIDGTAGPPSAVAYAFQAASRRGVGITVIHACEPWMEASGARGGGRRSIDNLRRLAGIEVTLQTYRDEYPDVDVRRRFVQRSAGEALVAESEAAALVVIGDRPQGRLHHALFSSVAHIAFRWAQSPIAIIRASRANECWASS